MADSLGRPVGVILFDQTDQDGWMLTMWLRLIDTRLVQTCFALAPTLLLSPTTHAREARPDITVASRLQTGSPYHMIICGHSGTFDLDVNGRTGTMIEVPGGIVNRAWRKSPGFDFRDDEDHNKVYVTPRANTPSGTETSIRFWLASGREATIHASVVEHTRGIEDNVLLYHQSERETLGLAHEPNPCEPRPDRTIARLIARATERHAHGPIARAVPVVEGVTKSGHALDVSVLLAEWEGDDMVLDFEAINPDFQPSRLTAIEVFDHAGERLDMKLLSPNPRQVGDASALAIVTSHHAMSGSILLPGAVARDVGSMEIRFHGIKGTSPYFTAVKVVRFRPVTEEETEREARAKQVAVSVRGLFGGFWTDAGDELGGLDGTIMTGFGVRVQKGYQWGGAFEGELVYAGSGDAQFDNATWSGMSGNITRRARLGRALGGVAMRFGHDYVFTGRVGLGLQLASYDSTFTTGATSMDGPGDGFQIGGVWSVGAGFDARLGEHWALGAATTFVQMIGDGARSLEAGLHLGYGWN